MNDDLGAFAWASSEVAYYLASRDTYEGNEQSDHGTVTLNVFDCSEDKERT